MGPANTCGALKPVTAKMFLPQNTIFFLSFYVWVQKVIVSEFFSMSLALCCGVLQLFGLVATGLDAKTTYTMGLYASAFSRSVLLVPTTQDQFCECLIKFFSVSVCFLGLFSEYLL